MNRRGRAAHKTPAGSRNTGHGTGEQNKEDSARAESSLFILRYVPVVSQAAFSQQVRIQHVQRAGQLDQLTLLAEYLGTGDCEFHQNVNGNGDDHSLRRDAQLGKKDHQCGGAAAGNGRRGDGQDYYREHCDRQPGHRDS